MRDLIFDTPLWLLGLFAVLGIGLWFSGNARRENRLQYAGYASVLLAVLLAVVSHFVDTDREIVTRRTRQIVEAVSKKDSATALKLLHPRATLGDMNRQQIADRIGTAADQFGVKSVRITSLDVTPQPLGEEITAALAATADLADNPYSGAGIPSTWDLTWVKSNNEWLLRDITPKSIPRMDVHTLLNRLQSLKPFGQ
jgi:hypothetical protein